MTTKHFYQVQVPWQYPLPFATNQLCQYNDHLKTFKIYRDLFLERSYQSIAVLKHSSYDAIFLYHNLVDNKIYLNIDGVDHLWTGDFKQHNKRSIIDLAWLLEATLQFYPNRLFVIHDSGEGIRAIYHITNQLNVLYQGLIRDSLPVAVLYHIDTIHLFTKDRFEIRHQMIRNGKRVASQWMIREQFKFNIIFSPNGSCFVKYSDYYANVIVYDSLSRQPLYTLDYIVPFATFQFSNNNRLLIYDGSSKIITIYDTTGTIIMTIQAPVNGLAPLQLDWLNHYRSNNNYLIYANNDLLFLIDTEQLTYSQLDISAYKYLNHGFVMGNLLILFRYGQNITLEYNTLKLERLPYYIDDTSLKLRQALTEYALSERQMLPPEMIEKIAQEYYGV